MASGPFPFLSMEISDLRLNQNVQSVRLIGAALWVLACDGAPLPKTLDNHRQKGQETPCVEI